MTGRNHNRSDPQPLPPPPIRLWRRWCVWGGRVRVVRRGDTPTRRPLLCADNNVTFHHNRCALFLFVSFFFSRVCVRVVGCCCCCCCCCCWWWCRCPKKKKKKKGKIKSMASASLAFQKGQNRAWCWPPDGAHPLHSAAIDSLQRKPFPFEGNQNERIKQRTICRVSSRSVRSVRHWINGFDPSVRIHVATRKWLAKLVSKIHFFKILWKKKSQGTESIAIGKSTETDSVKGYTKQHTHTHTHTEDGWVGGWVGVVGHFQ